MSMPGYREQYPEQDDIDARRDYDDWIDGYLAMEYERYLYEQEQDDGYLTDMDYLILDMMIMDDDWD
ncbi:MAG: hypothetical protein V3S81_01680 [Anaerolineales bacterium]